jgi:hypothetical protein
MNQLPHTVCREETHPESNHGFVPDRFSNSLEPNLVVSPDIVDHCTLSCNRRPNRVAGKDPGYRINRYDPEHVLDGAAGFDRPAPENISRPNPPPFRKVCPERLDKTPGRRLFREWTYNKIVIEPENVPAGIRRHDLHRIRTGTPRVIRAVHEILFSLTRQGNKIAAVRSPAGPAIPAGRFPHHERSLSPVQIVSTIKGL